MSWMSILSDLAEVGITEAKIDQAIANDPVVKGAVIMMTEKVRDTWQEIWDEAEPVGKHPYETGSYRESIRCEYVTKPSGYFHGVVRTRDPKAHWLEYGTARTPEFAPARRTVDYFNGAGGDDHVCGPDRANGGNEAGSVSA